MQNNRRLFLLVEFVPVSFVSLFSRPLFPSLVTNPEDASHVAITDSGMEKFFADLGLSADGVDSLLVAWQFSAATLGEFSNEEFINGMKKLRYASNAAKKKKKKKKKKKRARQRSYRFSAAANRWMS